LNKGIREGINYFVPKKAAAKKRGERRECFARPEGRMLEKVQSGLPSDEKNGDRIQFQKKGKRGGLNKKTTSLTTADNWIF